MEIIPTPLTISPQKFTEDMQKLSLFFSTFHIDIADGLLVPGKTATVEELTPHLLKYQDRSFDFHLMVQDYGKPINYLRSLSSKLQIGRVFVHHKAAPDKGLFVSHSDPFIIGLALNPSEHVKTLPTYYSLEFMRAIQIMSVEPGAQGQLFIKETLNKIEQLRLLNYRNNIFLDGGVNNLTLPLILSQRYTPDILSVGSYFSKASDLKINVEELKKMLPLEPLKG